MKKKIAVLAGILAIAPTSTLNASVHILGERISSKEVCPEAKNSKCVIKSDDAQAQYIGRYPKFITLGPDGEPIFSQYIGRQFTPAMAKGLNYCGNLSSKNVIADYASTQGEQYLQRTIHHDMTVEIKAKKLVSIDANVDAVQIATAAGVPASQTEQVTAAIAAAYKKARSKDMTIKGQFEFWEINPEITSAINAADIPDTLKPCRAWLEQGNSFVTALSGFKLDSASLSTGLETTFNASLDASLKGALSETQIAALKANFASELKRKVETSFSPSFTLLTMSHFRLR